MSGQLLRAIVRATHCGNTHHRFAWDAIPLVQTESGQRLTQILLRHHHRYLTGAVDPDNRFCDYQNHVIHARDGYWGGAPRVAHQWYERLQRYLLSNRFSDAAHAAGVLSHYFTDPLQPLHTHHDAREKVLHGPIEWSVDRSYRSILRGWKQNELRIVYQLSDGPQWLGEAILHSARFANRKYELLLEQYDLTRTLTKPQEAMTPDARDAIAELFGLAITGWARVLERIGADAESARGGPLPSGSTVIPTTFACLTIPVRSWTNWFAKRRWRNQLRRLIDEFDRTGTVQENLPHDVDIVHRVVQVHADEQRWKRERRRRLASHQTVIEVQSPATIPFPKTRPRRRAA